MFGIGISEMILIFLVIVVIIRPDDLPKFLRSAGRTYGKAKKLYKEIIDAKDKIIKEIDEATTIEGITKTTPTAKETPPKAAATKAPAESNTPSAESKKPTEEPAPISQTAGPQGQSVAAEQAETKET